MKAVLGLTTTAVLLLPALLLAWPRPAQSSDALQRMVPVYAYLYADYDGDGVRNRTDKCRTTPAGAVVDAIGCSQGDDDGDGLANVYEATIYGTDPSRADTDGDGISDSAELAYWGASWSADADGDGLSNLIDADSDNDRIPDGWEISNGLNPSANDSALDTDGDGVSNYIEYRVGTNPLNPNDTPVLRTTYEYNARGEVKTAVPVIRQAQP